MNHYLEIRLLPDPEFGPSLLLNALYNKLHLALAKLNCNDLGVSFPHYRQSNPDKSMHPLGERIRIHGTRERIEELMAINWLSGMRDHVRIGSIHPVPNKVNYVIYRRVQFKSSVERIRRRHMRRHNLGYEEVARLIPENIEQSSDLPFITLRSQSTKQYFKLFIQQQEIPNSTQGNFNTYGLSTGTTVPLF
ncbi:MAG: csy4 1 [Gammaproteobacteria bacterium]|jgi:CRISPR-associated endonuclease Csy4|nr:csy4 1 [Gammaproteobacteria bacterium]